MRRMAPLLCVCFLGQTQADNAVTIATDRPSVTASSTTVPPGGLQIESGLQATDNGGEWTLDAPELLRCYGLLRKTELRLVLPNYLLTLPAQRSSPHGFGDVTVAMEEQLGPIGGFDLALIPLSACQVGRAPFPAAAMTQVWSCPGPAHCPPPGRWRASSRQTGRPWMGPGTTRVS
jgi:hypothetical protein